MASKKFMYVNRKAPHGSVYALESLEVVLIGAAFEQDVSLAFVDDGVFQLMQNQDTAGIGAKNFSPTFKALGDYDVSKIYVEQESLEARATRGPGPRRPALAQHAVDDAHEREPAAALWPAGRLGRIGAPRGGVYRTWASVRIRSPGSSRQSHPSSPGLRSPRQSRPPSTARREPTRASSTIRASASA